MLDQTADSDMGGAKPRKRRDSHADIDVGSGLAEDMLADCLMVRRGQSRRMAPREILFVEGDPVESLFLILSGTIRCCIFAEDGRRLITRFATAGDFLGFASGERFAYTAEAVDRVSVTSCPRAVFEAKLATSPGLCLEMRRLISRELSASCSLMMTHMRLYATERILWFLRGYSERTGIGPEGYVSLPMTRQDIADHLGLTIETVSRTFSSLKASGQIEMPSSKRYRILGGEETGGLSVAA